MLVCWEVTKRVKGEVRVMMQLTLESTGWEMSHFFRIIFLQKQNVNLETQAKRMKERED